MSAPMMAILEQVEFRLLRLEAHARRHDKMLMELLETRGVLNRKVELIHDQQEANSFLEEEDAEKHQTPRASVPRLPVLPQGDEETRATPAQTD